MIEDWIDILCAAWEIDLDGFQTVKSYKLIADSDFPDSIDPSELDKKPIALTIPGAVQPRYSKGNKTMRWFGITEFHVSPDLNRGRLPGLIMWYGRILKAAALKVQLSGTTAEIASFEIVDRPDGIQGPMALKYGNEAEHWGFIVNWMVDESLNGSQLPVSG